MTDIFYGIDELSRVEQNGILATARREHLAEEKTEASVGELCDVYADRRWSITICAAASLVGGIVGVFGPTQGIEATSLQRICSITGTTFSQIGNTGDRFAETMFGRNRTRKESEKAKNDQKNQQISDARQRRIAQIKSDTELRRELTRAFLNALAPR